MTLDDPMSADDPTSAIAEPRWRTERTYPPYPLLAVSIAVFRAGRVLLATRTRPPYAGAFSLPGGLVETGETLQEAALRELREEVQVEARIIGFNRHVEWIDRDDAGKVLRHYVIASFVSEWIAGVGEPGPEAGEIIWIAPQNLGRITCTPHVVAVIASAEALLRSNL